jgi:DNA polymerase-3 subunit alpha
LEQAKDAIRDMSNLIKNFKKYDLDIKGVRLPSFNISLEEKERVGVDKDCSNFDFLKALCADKLKEIKKQVSPEEFKEYQARARKEIKILEELSFIDYILLVWDVIRFCKKEGIATGMGRGSAAGSLILYLIGVTKIDSLKYDLYFERFVSKVRAKKQVVNGVTYLDGSLMADIDLDICYYDRSKVLKYLEQKFKGKTSKILTLNTLSGKLVMKECGKIVAGKDEGEVNKVSDMIPKKYGTVKDIYESYEEVEDFRNWCDENYTVFKIACKLRGLIKNKSVHPSAILLSYDDLEDTCPTELDSSKESIVSSYDANWVSMFTVKLDVLGLRGVSVVQQTINNIEKDFGKKFRQEQIVEEFCNFDKTWVHLQEMNSRHGLFQIEADTAFKVCKKVKPESLEELSAVLALARPGAIDFTEQYADVKKSNSSHTIHPFFDKLLSKTNGVALYQEQLMKMANEIGFSLDDAELLRRIVGKKKVNEVKKWQKKVRKLVNKSDELKVKNEEGQDAGEVFWKILEDSANYSFNKSHSISYAALCAVTVFLKFNYPKQFFLSLLQMTKHEPDPMDQISRVQKELDLFEIPLLPPHILKSKQDFSIEGDAIRFGLSSIRGVSETTMEKIDNFRSDKAYDGLSKFEVFLTSKEAGINIGVLSALIQAGALEGFGITRTLLVYEAQLWNLLTDREKQHICKNDFKFAKEYNLNLVKIVKALDEVLTEKGKKFLRGTRLNTLKTKAEPYKQIFDMNNKNQEFANWYYEKHFLGYAYHTTLQKLFNVGGNIRDVESAFMDDKVKFVGWVDEAIKKKSKKGSSYQQLMLSDEKAEMRTMIFNKKMEKCEESNNGKLPAKTDIVIVNGTKKDGVVFADTIEVADVTIYTKLSELKG